jgi:hypothetical protein
MRDFSGAKNKLWDSEEKSISENLDFLYHTPAILRSMKTVNPSFKKNSDQ